MLIFSYDLNYERVLNSGKVPVLPTSRNTRTHFHIVANSEFSEYEIDFTFLNTLLFIAFNSNRFEVDAAFRDLGASPMNQNVHLSAFQETIHVLPTLACTI